MDSGADISVVPESVVGVNHFTGDEVTLSGFNGSPCVAKLAEVLFEINGKSFVERAAIVPAHTTTNGCVLL